MDKRWEIILDLFLVNELGQISAVERGANDVYEQDVVTSLILTLPLGEHPVEYVKQYVRGKGLNIQSVRLMPAVYLNRFDSEPEVDYLVMSFSIKVEGHEQVKGDQENSNIVWMSVDDFVNHEKLMPEFKRSGLKHLIDDDPMFYKGCYRETDGSFEVIEWEEV